MAIWSWNASGQASKSLVVQKALPSAIDSYGERRTSDLAGVDVTLNFDGDGLTWTEVKAILTTMDTPGGTVSFTDVAGQAWVGVPVSLNWRRIRGTAYLEAQMGLQPEGIEDLP